MRYVPGLCVIWSFVCSSIQHALGSCLVPALCCVLTLLQGNTLKGGDGSSSGHPLAGHRLGPAHGSILCGLHSN